MAGLEPLCRRRIGPNDRPCPSSARPRARRRHEAPHVALERPVVRKYQYAHGAIQTHTVLTFEPTPRQLLQTEEGRWSSSRSRQPP